MELKDVYELWDRFDSSKATLIELELKGDHLKLVKGVADSEVLGASSITERTSYKKAVANDIEEVSENANENTAKKVSVNAEGTPVKAPLVGTFYASPSPDEEPFVTVGKMVKKGDVVGIIEAMKLMNEVVAPVDGKVTKIEAKDGCMVQYEQTILVIE